jgi:hypothetical protein
VPAYELYVVGDARILGDLTISDRFYCIDSSQTHQLQGKVKVLGSAGGGGFIGTRGPNGQYNCRFSSLSTNFDHGFITARDASGASQASMYVNSSGKGVVSADVKNFHVPHPDDPNLEIWYACPEGPEAAIYHRGTARLVNGRATVSLPRHFAVLASAEGITVQVTPLTLDSNGLGVVRKAVDRIVVGELGGGTGSYAFDYVVMANRKAYEDYQVIRDPRAPDYDRPAEPDKPVADVRKVEPREGGAR